MSCLVSICGRSGAGKSTLLDAIVDEIDLTVVKMDDFTCVLNGYSSMSAWVRSKSRSFDDWESISFFEYLHKIKNEDRMVLVEDPFGPLRQDGKILYSKNVFLSCRPDIALCNKLKRLIKVNNLIPADELLVFLNKYLDDSSWVYQLADNSLEQMCDLTIESEKALSYQIRVLKNFLFNL